MIIDPGHLTFPQLASPPASTALGSSGTAGYLGVFTTTLVSGPDGSGLTPTLAGAGAGNLSNGVYSYKFTWVTDHGETTPGAATPTVTVVDSGTNGKTVVLLPDGQLPVYPTALRIYRTVAGGSTYLFHSEVSQYALKITDNTADASLGAAAPTTNTAIEPSYSLTTNGLISAPTLTNWQNPFYVFDPGATDYVTLMPAARDAGYGAAIELFGGSTTAGPAGGGVFLFAGVSDVGDGGYIHFAGADAAPAAFAYGGSGNGGRVESFGGQGVGAGKVGGDIVLRPGGAASGATAGNVVVKDAANATALTISGTDKTAVFASSASATNFLGGTWQGKTLTLANSLITSGNFSLTLTTTNTTNVTLPTTGTLATLAGSEAFTNKTGNISQWTNDSGYLTASTGAPIDATYITQTANGSLSAEQALSSLSSGIMRVATTTGVITSLGDVLPVANGGTAASSASITAFNNITGLSAAGTTGTTTTNLVFSTSPTLVTPAITTSATLSNNGIATTSTVGLVLQNTTPATSLATVQYSPALQWIGHGWKSNSVAADHTIDVLADLEPVSLGSGAVGGVIFKVRSPSYNSGNYSSVLRIGYDQQNANPVLDFTVNPIAVGSAGYVILLGTGQAIASATYHRLMLESSGTIYFGDPSTSVPSILNGGGGAIGINNADTLITRGGAAATVQFGSDVNGAAVNQTLQAANGITGNDKTGGNLTLRPGAGTGAGAVSSLIIQTPTVGTGGTGTAQTQATRLTINSTTFTLAEALDVVLGTTTGTKIGTATSQKIGFWNATPIIQPAAAGQAAFTDSTGGVAAASLVDVTTAAATDPVKTNANFATVSVLLLAMRTALVNAGLMKGAA